MHRETIAYPLPERVTQQFTGIVKDETGALIPAASLAAMTLTLYNEDTGNYINSRNDQSILNINGGTVDISGNWVLTLSPADMAIEDITKKYEKRIAQVKWTYSGGMKTGLKLIEFHVENLTKIT